jgi:hypothetical protein
LRPREIDAMEKIGNGSAKYSMHPVSQGP